MHLKHQRRDWCSDLIFIRPSRYPSRADTCRDCQECAKPLNGGSAILANRSLVGMTHLYSGPKPDKYHHKDHEYEFDFSLTQVQTRVCRQRSMNPVVNNMCSLQQGNSPALNDILFNNCLNNSAGFGGYTASKRTANGPTLR